jgi:hypothetical protein
MVSARWNAVDYGRARQEHAMLLRCEGLTLRAIGARIGVYGETARQMILKAGSRTNASLRRSKARFKLTEAAPGDRA